MTEAVETEKLVELARELAPTFRERARDAERLRRMPDDLLPLIEPFLGAVVPKRWGGQGLGARALCEVARELAHGDGSMAWTTSFLMEHSWMACHLAFEAQEELFSERPYILASAPLTPAGRAEPVEGGYRVWGTFRYASCIGNSDLSFASAPIEEDGVRVPRTFLIPLSEVTVNDDWLMSGMAATSSASFTADGVFVPEKMSLPLAQFFSADGHPGAAHEEAFMRYPVKTIAVMMAAIPLGVAEGAVELMRERMPKTVVMGTVPRIELPVSRVRWGKALQKVRCARLLYDDVLDQTIANGDAIRTPSEAEAGQQELDLMTVARLSKEAVDLVCDGMGSSTFKLSDPLQRAQRDANVMANHYFHDEDVVAERGTRFVLGLGPSKNDPWFLMGPPKPAGDEQAAKSV